MTEMSGGHPPEIINDGEGSCQTGWTGSLKPGKDRFGFGLYKEHCKSVISTQHHGISTR